jgi:small-conductance mechanosensitive channel
VPLLPLGARSYSLLDVVILLALLLLLIRAVGLVLGLLRTRVLRYTGLSLGGQEAVAFLTRYGLLFFGALVLLQLWGLDLSSLTLFASVLGVGVGLGFQTISKNLLSGMVIIFERPIQVGDFVEIGDLQGTVQKLGLRSTVVETLDRIAIIVPNSEFLDSRVVNWSHGSPVSRLQVPVGVAYGSDTTAVREALIAACEGRRSVLRDPPPQVFFSGFGDSSLNFTLLVWTSEPRRQYEIKSDLNFRIEALLRQRGITVPFPQRDLHLSGESLELRLSPELEARLTPPRDQPEAGSTG